MTTRRRHYQAYRLSTLREFSGLAALAPGVRELGDDTVCYVADDHDLVADPLAAHTSLLSGGMTNEWRAFCAERLAAHMSPAPDNVDAR